MRAIESASAVAVLGTFALLQGCAPGSQALLTPAASSAGATHVVRAVDRAKPAHVSYVRALYVVDPFSNTVKILTDVYYRELGAITNGLDGTQNLTMDGVGNLYAANYFGRTITEYAPGATSPSFTYSAGMGDPSTVAVDRHGNVYEADAAGYINQYFQGLDSVTQSCSTSPGYPVGIAVDSNDDVFAAVASGSVTVIDEYKGGLSGCAAVPLGVSFPEDLPGRLAVDKNNNLIYSDGDGGAVDVIDPPYASITRTIGSGFSHPGGVSLNKTNKLVFVADENNNTVTVVNYQTGANVTVLGAEHGITAAWGVVDGPNAVY